MKIPVLLAMSAALLCADNNHFDWNGALRPGQEIEVKGVHGSIHAVASSGTSVEVTAVKTGRRSDPASVEIVVVPHEGGVTVCSVYPSEGTRRNDCAPGKSGHMDVHHNDVKVQYEIHVPAGVRFTGRNVNGNIEAEGLTAGTIARTVNGDIRLDSKGSADAETVNGSIDAAAGAALGDLKFTTVNGSVTVAMPASLNAQLHASTVNGRIDSDFPVTAHGSLSSRKLDGSIGKGGPELDLTTLNGSVHSRKADRTL